MFKLDESADRARGESEPGLDQSGVAVAGRIGVLRRAAAALAIGSSLLVAGVHAGVAHADQYPPGSIYGTQYGVVPSDSVPQGQVDTLTSQRTGLVADDANNSGSPGTQMIQWPADGGYNQNWVFVPSTGANAGYDEIQNRQSGLCLDVSGASTADDAPVIQWTCTGNANQQWQVHSVGTNAVALQNENSGGYLAVAGGENEGDPGQGAGLVQYVGYSGGSDTAVWLVTPTSYRILTDKELAMGHGANDPPELYYYSTIGDDTTWTCQSDYHFRMASAGAYSGGHWTTFPQAAVDQAESPQTAVSAKNNQISTQQGPDGGYFPFAGFGQGIDENGLQQPISWTDAQVSSPGSSGVTDSDPSGASAGYGSVSIGYGYTTAFQGQDLEAQVILHCDPN
jgi:hypothetical protein